MILPIRRSGLGLLSANKVFRKEVDLTITILNLHSVDPDQLRGQLIRIHTVLLLITEILQVNLITFWEECST